MLKVTVITASSLPAKEQTVMKKALAKKHNQEVQVDFRVDSAVVGGVKIVAGSKAVDMTVTGQLAQIKKQLLAQI